jgi:hypothetical protein
VAINFQKLRQKSGSVGEEIVAAQMRVAGYLFIEQVNTALRAKLTTEGVKYYAKKTVSGDIRAINSKGGSVLVEVKKHDSGNLPWSCLRKPTMGGIGQAATLTCHSKIQGTETYLAWVKGGKVKFMKWPVPGFCKDGDSVKW